jgi:predicted small lipoprotein YifL
MLHLKPYFLAILVSFTLLICACGQTGDLYLPEDEPKAEPKVGQEKTSKEKSKT